MKGPGTRLRPSFLRPCAVFSKLSRGAFDIRWVTSGFCITVNGARAGHPTAMSPLAYQIGSNWVVDEDRLKILAECGFSTAPKPLWRTCDVGRIRLKSWSNPDLARVISIVIEGEWLEDLRRGHPVPFYKMFPVFLKPCKRWTTGRSLRWRWGNYIFTVVITVRQPFLCTRQRSQFLGSP